MEKLVTNYHTHTKRCGHAYGEDEDFVLSAIKYGIKELGFTILENRDIRSMER